MADRTDHRWDYIFNLRSKQGYDPEGGGEPLVGEFSSYAASKKAVEHTAFVHWVEILRAEGIKLPWKL